MSLCLYSFYTGLCVTAHGPGFKKGRRYIVISDNNTTVNPFGAEGADVHQWRQWTHDPSECSAHSDSQSHPFESDASDNNCESENKEHLEITKCRPVIFWINVTPKELILTWTSRFSKRLNAIFMPYPGFITFSAQTVHSLTLKEVATFLSFSGWTRGCLFFRVTSGCSSRGQKKMLLKSSWRPSALQHTHLRVIQ